MTEVRGIYVVTPQRHGQDEYREICEDFQLPVTPTGWGLLLVVDGDGSRSTLVTDDAGYVELAAAGLVAGVISDADPFQLDPGKFCAERPGWVGDWQSDEREAAPDDFVTDLDAESVARLQRVKAEFDADDEIRETRWVQPPAGYIASLAVACGCDPSCDEGWVHHVGGLSADGGQEATR